MPADSNVSLRAARLEDAETVFNITKASIAGLAGDCYSPAQIENWMGERTPRLYEDLFAKGRMTVCLRNGVVVGFVDAEPGEVTRLFVLPEAAGAGLGLRLRDIGVARARAGHSSRRPGRRPSSGGRQTPSSRHSAVSVLDKMPAAGSALGSRRLAREPFGPETFAVGIKRLLRGFMVAHGLFRFDPAGSIARLTLFRCQRFASEGKIFCHGEITRR